MGHMGLAPLRYGSPFTYRPYQNKEDFFIGLLDKSTRYLFDQVVAEATDLRQRLSTALSQSDKGDGPQLCWLKGCESSKDTDAGEESDANESKLEICTIYTDYIPWRLKADILYDRNSETGEIEYFIRNNGSDTIRVNEWNVQHAVEAGPLPEFAVFEIPKYSCFWWRTTADLDYKPVSGPLSVG